MNDQRDPNDPADDLEGFDSFEEPMDDQMLEDEPLDDAALDADFQDLPEDEIDADVFGEGEPAEAPAKKKTNWFNIGVAVVAIVVAGGLVWSKLGPSLLGNANAPAPMAINQDNLVRSPNDANEAAQAALSPAANAPAVQGGLLDDPEKFSTLAQNSQPVDVPGPAAQPVIADPFAGLPATPTQAAQAELNAGVPMPAPIMPAIPGSPDIAAMPAPITPAEQAAVTTPMPTPALATPPLDQQAPVAVVTTTETTMPAAAVNTSQAPVDIALESKVNAMESRLEQMDQKLTAAVERIENAAPADNSQLASIQTALERLESRLDTMNSAPRQQVAARESNDTPAPAKRASTPKKTAKPKTQPSAYDAPYSPTQAVQVSSSGGSGGWELRGATNGRAIIAKGSDIREVGVGENVPGMGEITGVAQINGAWVVQGTGGRLSQ